MMKHKLASALVALSVWGLGAGAAFGADPVLGVWRTQAGDGTVEIAPCGDSVCGRVRTADVPPGQTDVRNPDPTLRTREIVGLRILEGFQRTDRGWVGGTIYDPETGRTYRADLLPQESGALRLKGCIRNTPLCQSQTWTRLN